MTGFLRNPEVRRTLFLSLLLSLAAGGTGLVLLGGKGGVFGFLTGLVMTCVQILVTFRRYRSIRKLASEIDAILHGAELHDIRGTSEGELAILRTEVGKMTLRLREHEQALIADKQFLADSLADISHQLRTPLTSIQLLLTLLSKRDLTEMRRIELLGELRSLLTRIDWLVDALLKYSKLDAGSVQLRQDTVPLSQLLDTACTPLQIPLELRGIELRTKAEGTFCGDVAWTAEAIGNIVKNCMEHTPEGGRVTVQGSENPLFTEIVITDSGSGIRKEDLPHIFERFYQGERTAQQGFGIGLALARRIVTGQNGTLKAENLPTHGAKFSIRFYKSAV
ncbi:MAG: HAMP domain-containing histidine kinase [Oscillospiraceae bacterium]|nr:HAMP domain-containing histidine kinase [Oscillospiraceae bacterium]